MYVFYYTIYNINRDVFSVSDYLQDGRPTSVQGPDLENQNSLDSGESCLFGSSSFVSSAK